VYIRTEEEALTAVAEILDLRQRRDQLVQSTVKIMLCLEAEPRAFLGDCQALLIEGGLEALQQKRREFLAKDEPVPVVVLDPEDDRLFETTARALDALRFSGVVLRVFPEFARVFERWWIARALLTQEEEIRKALTAAIRARRYAEEFDPLRLAVQAAIVAQRPEWIEQAGALRAACLDALRLDTGIPAERLEEAAEAVFNVLATSDEWIRPILRPAPDDPAAVGDRIRQAFALLEAARSIPSPSSPFPGDPGISRVA
jgi:hypothetical protein